MKLLHLGIAAIILLSLTFRSALAEEPVTLRVLGGAAKLRLIQAEWRRQGGRLELVSESEGSLADTILSKNDQIDLICLTSWNGLDSIKRTHTWYPLPEDQSQLLYPRIREALTADGQLMGWPLHVQPFFWLMEGSILEELGASKPETFDEVLDAVRDLPQSEAWSSDYTLFADVACNQREMLELYVTMYIRAGLVQGRVDFLRPEFARTVGRIRSELPAEARVDEYAGAVFASMLAYQYLPADFDPPPRVLSDEEAAIPTVMSVLFVNPYSAHLEEAIRLMTFVMARTDPDAYAFRQDLTEPVVDEKYVAELDRIYRQIAGLRALSSPSAAQEKQLRELTARAEQLEASKWLISEAAVRRYQDIAGQLYILEAAPVTYDDSLRALSGQFLAGAYTPAQYAEACQRHVRMIELEYGIE